MDVRAQVSMVFHLDKCIGCHTCSIACKNLWSDRKGAEYMWWNNVETKPGTGYPTLWEDQSKYQGGWEVKDGRLQLRSTGKVRGLANIFYNPTLPTIDDYYEPWTYRYQDLFDSPAGDDQPTAVPISSVTGEYIDIQAGPNWDDDMGGSPIYAANDPNLVDLTAEERQQMLQFERLTFFYVPRICNHCLNPGCVAACPSGALYKRGEDGIVLVSQEKCRGWRFCVSGCPYKKVYYNWSTGKSEKCILCYPRQEDRIAPACFHTCVGRIRYLGPVFYDAERLEAAASVPDEQLVEAQRDIILDPFSPAVIDGARAKGISDQWILAAQQSPIYKLVKLWRIALPLRAEFRTMPMLFYVPPLLPVMASIGENGYRLDVDELFAGIDQARLPFRYMARLLGAGNQTVVREAILKLAAVRVYERSKTVGDVSPALVERLLTEAGCSPAEAEEIFRMTALAGPTDRHAVPPFQRERAIEQREDPGNARRHRHRPEGPTSEGVLMAESGFYLDVAAMLEYPTESLAGLARGCSDRLGQHDPENESATLAGEFATSVGSMTLAELEELYTATFDLNPSCSPYVGDQLLKDPPKRAALLVKLKEGYRAVGLDSGRELPDHVALLLRYLAALGGEEPAGELRDLLIVPGLEKMETSLGEANPYGKLVKAALAMLGGSNSDVPGGIALGGGTDV